MKPCLFTIPIISILVIFSGASASAATATAAESKQVLPIVLINTALREDAPDLAAGLAKALGRADAKLAWLSDYTAIYQKLNKREYSEAEQAARALLHRKPDDPDVRHALINVLWAQKKYRAAIYQIGQNEGRISDPHMQATYKALMDEYEAINKSYGITVSVGAAPSSNINNGTSAKQVSLGGISFDLNEESRAQKGINLSGNASAFYLIRLAENTDLVAKASAHLTKSLETHEMDQLTFILSPEIQHSFDEGRFGVGPLLEYQLAGYDAYALRYGIGLFVRRTISPDIKLGVQGKFMRQDYYAEDFRDGFKLDLDSSIGFELPSDIHATVALKYQRETTERAYLSSHTQGLGIELERKWESLGGLQTAVELHHQWQDFDASYPLLGKPRSDRKLTAAIKFSHPAIQIYGVSPSLGYEYIDNSSNVEMKSFQAHNFIIGFNRQF